MIQQNFQLCLVLCLLVSLQLAMGWAAAGAMSGQYYNPSPNSTQGTSSSYQNYYPDENRYQNSSYVESIQNGQMLQCTQCVTDIKTGRCVPLTDEDVDKIQKKMGPRPPPSYSPPLGDVVCVNTTIHFQINGYDYVHILWVGMVRSGAEKLAGHCFESPDTELAGMPEANEEKDDEVVVRMVGPALICFCQGNNYCNGNGGGQEAGYKTVDSEIHPRLAGDLIRKVIGQVTGLVGTVLAIIVRELDT